MRVPRPVFVMRKEAVEKTVRGWKRSGNHPIISVSSPVRPDKGREEISRMSRFPVMPSCLDLAGAARDCRTDADLRGLFNRLEGLMSADYSIVGVSDDRTTDFVWSDFPLEWTRNYLADQLMDIDPILRYQMATNGAVCDWSIALGQFPISSWLPLGELSSDLGLRNGISASLREPGTGRRAVMSVSARRRSFSAREAALLEMLFPHLLLAALRVRGEADSAVPPLQGSGPADSGTFDLTARECEVLGLIARGCRTAEAASALGLSPHTVHGYVKTIYQKLHVSTRAEAVLEAVRRGLVDPV